jgi:FG-GAP-like repeat/IPT/TIG domain/Secretion system C-terminal sorting domain
MRIQKPHLFFLPLIFVVSDLFAQPTITSFSPTSGPVGISVTITGTNFSTTPSNNIVFFGAVKANVTAASATSLTVTIPAGITQHPITVTVGGLTAYSGSSFVQTFPGGVLTSASFVYAASADNVTGLDTDDLVTADMDGDGKPDLVVVDQTNGFFAFYKNTSSGVTISFGPRMSFLAGNRPQRLAVGDIDGDGKLDVAVANTNDNNISVFRNTTSSGAISFAPKVNFAASNLCLAICIADLDSDGKPDIATASTNTTNNISILRNTGSVGTIAFAPKTDLTVIGALNNIVARDINNDNKPDLAVTNFGVDQLSILRNTSTAGSISFATSVDFPTGPFPDGISLGDIDGDGKIDISIAYFNLIVSGTSVYRNTSAGSTISFAPRIDYAAGDASTSCDINDLDGDAKRDLSVLNNLESIFVYKNNSSSGTITLIPKGDFPSLGSDRIVSCDLNADGKPELAVIGGVLRVRIFRNESTKPQITSFTPASAGPGATITIKGGNFTGVTAISFGGIAASSFAIVNDTTITAVVNNGASGAVSASAPYGIGSKDGFIFQGPPVVISFTPTSGYNFIPVTISGYNFNNATAVSFGGVPANSFTVVNSTTITAVVGTGASGNVSVSTSYGTGSLAGFTFVPVPLIYSFTPTTAATGATITIGGANFTGTTSVSFGGVAASSFTIVNSTMITAVVGSGASGNVIVTNSFGSDTLSGFTYIPPPIVSSFAPTSAGTGTTVTITGSNFNGVTFVRFGVLPAASFNVVNSTTITAVVGGGASGSVSVTTAGGTGSLPGFVYIPPPTVTSFYPVMTGTGGVITIVGNNLSNATSVSFGGTAAVSFSIISFDTIRATLANGSSGAVSVTTPGGNGFLNGFQFTSSPVINVVSPVSGPIGTTVTISGANFLSNLSNVSVNFGGIKGNVLSASANSITVSVPAGVTNEPISVTMLPSNFTAYSNTIFNTTFTGGENAFDNNSYSGKIDFTTGIKPYDIELADINSDGKLDMIVCTFGSSFISIFRNTSTGGQLSFAPRIGITVGVEVSSLVVHDMNGDGKPDLVLAREKVVNATRPDIVVLKNIGSSGSISFDTPQPIYTSERIDVIEVGDLNLDGKPDIVGLCNVCGITNSYIPIFLNTGTNGNISFGEPIRWFTGATSQVTSTTLGSLSIRDLNGDSKPEIILALNVSDGYFIYKNQALPGQGGIAFNVMSVGNVDLNSPYPSESHAVADFDKDGDLDIAANHRVDKNLGNFNFQFELQLSHKGGLAFDLNGDSKTDLAGTETNSTVSIISLTKNTGSGTISFAPHFAYNLPLTFRKIRAGDLDGDGKPEICFTNLDSNTISILRNRMGESVPPAPSITSFMPASAGYGEQVTITGNNFNQTTSVTFGGRQTLSFTVNSPTSIVAVLGGGASGNVSVTTPGGTATASGFSYNAPPAPTISAFAPASAPQGGSVTIDGTNLLNASSVSFGNVSANSFTVQSSTRIIAEVGIGATGDVKVITPGGAATKSGFSFMSPPTITSYTPVSAGTGTPVTITGTNFTGATAVSFGGVNAQSFLVNSSTSITATVGNGASGNVVVTTPAGTAIKTGFNYIPAPTITSFSPMSGSAGTVIIINGTNFLFASAVSFGSTPAQSFSVNSSTMIIATVGTGSSGNISITTLGGTATIAGFSFIAPAPTITSFTPSSGSTGSVITITGTNFTGATGVSFGGTPAQSFTVTNSTTITATVGAGSTGNISVTTSGGTATATGFTYNSVTGIGGPGSINSKELIVNPNPAKDFLIIKHPSSNKNAELNFYDILGRKVKTILPVRNSTRTDVTLNYMTPGTYTIVWSDGIRVLSRIIVIN